MRIEDIYSYQYINIYVRLYIIHHIFYNIFNVLSILYSMLHSYHMDKNVLVGIVWFIVHFL
jgi:hypothetical protein